MNAVLFNEPVNLFLYQGTGAIIVLGIPSLILFTLAGKKAKNILFIGAISLFLLFWIFFYPNLYNLITQTNHIQIKENILTAKNSLSNIIVSSPVNAVRFYCVYTISIRGNKFYNKAGIEVNNKIYYFSLERNCDKFNLQLKKLKLAMNYAERDSFPEIENQETRSLILRTVVIALGISIAIIVNRKYPIDGK